jgi:hypothetical protein
MDDDRFAGSLRWYPPAWRIRYGEEMVTLMNDVYGHGDVPLRGRLDIVRGGLRERVNGWGLGADGSPVERVRAGSVLVLVAWGFVTMGGLVFAKASEHWTAAASVGALSMPWLGFALVAGCAALAMIGIGAAFAMVVPPFARFVARGGWRQVRHSITGAMTLSAVTVVAGAGLSLWAQQLTNAQRNGADTGYGMAFVLVAVLLFASLAAWIVAAVDAARRVPLPDDVVRACGWIALGVTAASTLALFGTALWWAWFGLNVPSYISGTGSPLAVNLIGACASMLIGVCLAARGAARVVEGLRT